MLQLHFSEWIPGRFLRPCAIIPVGVLLVIGCLFIGPLAKGEQLHFSEQGEPGRETAPGAKSLAEILQDNAQILAIEHSELMADETWTRIEFAQWMVDPIVVAKPLNEHVSDPFVIGIRNVDTSGFEVRVRHCHKTDRNQPEFFSYYVLERDQYWSADKTFTMDAKQRFLWGKCEI
ncbi:hypothetical protein [Nitrosococcus watsonii]|uniref:Uncharacterized protein n=1 Tax=Nitrosococcus watsoni (strain C-113) TaxID=105559 RepID=D8KBF8_NITWC|nr:hypothetical protein [Nitrosococcus watsonii]ADJ29605.1 hypothetical protein Nwat_2854 [Nitrosococcus watsonii C-113]